MILQAAKTRFQKKTGADLAGAPSAFGIKLLFQ
jgi:hypothetical protein